VADYEIVLTAGAREAIREMSDGEKQQVARALREELLDRHAVANPHIEVPTGSPRDFMARWLASGHVAIFRPMTEGELKVLARQREKPLARSGVIVYDILSRDNAPRMRADLHLSSLGSLGSLG
jgi:hypothetical protein